ncbi:MAG: fibronectin-binding protein (FBP) [Chlorobiaceae bacterium]|nr:fibronectin-binding protein (FBP) [Chlorobiaceae bacterium]
MSTKHIIKTRDDKAPVEFVESGDEGNFKLVEGTYCSWITDQTEFGTDKLRSRIEPWLTALFQSEHFALLAGSGLSHAVHCIATENLLPGMRESTFTNYNAEILDKAKESAKLAGREEGNIEDQIRVVNELIRGIEILATQNSDFKKPLESLRSELKIVLGDFAASILMGENGLITALPEKREEAFNYLVSFLMSFASRTGTRDRLQVFTTNYDRFIEAGADTAGLHLIDRFVGALSPVFRSSRLDIDMHYNPPGIRGEPRYLEGVARFTKLHGSLDWISTEGQIRKIGLPFGSEKINPYLNAPGLSDGEALNLMIYPNAAKDRETAAYPYVELFRDFAAAVCRPNSTLISFGYSFGDEHINRVIEDMLTIPSAHLVVIAFGDPLGRIMQTYEKLGRHAQITLLIGPHLGDLQKLVDNYMPKPAIDRTTFKMSELLKSRWGTSHAESVPQPPEPDTADE